MTTSNIGPLEGEFPGLPATSTGTVIICTYENDVVAATAVTPGSVRMRSTTASTRSLARVGIATVRTLSGLNPPTCVRSKKLRISSPADVTSTIAIATCATTSTARVRPVRNPRERMPDFSVALRSVRESRRAGSSPTSIAVPMEINIVKASTAPSMRISAFRGNSGG